MAWDQLSNFSWYKFLVKFFLAPAHEACTNHEHEHFLRRPRGWGGKSLLLPVDKHTESSGWGTTLPKHITCQRSHGLLVSSCLRVNPLLPMLLWLVAWHGPHKKLLGILRVLNPATKKDLADRTWGSSCTNPKCRFCSRQLYKINKRDAHGSKARLQQASREAMRSAWLFFWIEKTHYLQCLFLSLVLWLWDSIWVIVPLTLTCCFWGRRFFLPSSLPLLVPLSLSLSIYIHIHI